jgi:hypothetical protein
MAVEASAKRPRDEMHFPATRFPFGDGVSCSSRPAELAARWFIFKTLKSRPISGELERSPAQAENGASKRPSSNLRFARPIAACRRRGLSGSRPMTLSVEGNFTLTHSNGQPAAH